MSRAAMQQALEALERYRVETPLGHQPHMIAEQADIAITALKQALAEHEPLGWITAGQHTAPLRTHWEGCEAVHPECRKPEQRGWFTISELNEWATKLPQPEQEPVCAHGVGKTKCGFCKQPEQEPYYGIGIDWGTAGDGPCCTIVKKLPSGVAEVIACENGPTPPQRKPLTDEEIDNICKSFRLGYTDQEFARAIEKAHGIGGSE